MHARHETFVSRAPHTSNLKNLMFLFFFILQMSRTFLSLSLLSLSLSLSLSHTQTPPAATLRRPLVRHLSLFSLLDFGVSGLFI
jgi:hypothetical protein